MAETSVYESARMTHEEIEQYEDALVNTLNNPPRALGGLFSVLTRASSYCSISSCVIRALSYTDVSAIVGASKEWDDRVDFFPT